MPHKNQKGTGSELTIEPAFLVLGKLRRPHGVRGEIPLELYTNLSGLLDPQKVVFVGEEHQPFTIENTRWKQELLLIKFLEINDRTVVSSLTNQLVYIKSDQLPPLEEGAYYHHQLIGLKVFEAEGSYLGILTEVIKTGANDVFLVQDDSGQEVLIPDTEEMILEINPDEQKMVVARIKWYGQGD